MNGKTIYLVAVFIPMIFIGMIWYLSFQEKFSRLVKSRKDQEFVEQAILMPGSRNWLRNQQSRERLKAIQPDLYRRMVGVYCGWGGTLLLNFIVMLLI